MHTKNCYGRLPVPETSNTKQHNIETMATRAKLRTEALDSFISFTGKNGTQYHLPLYKYEGSQLDNPDAYGFKEPAHAVYFDGVGCIYTERKVAENIRDLYHLLTKPRRSLLQRMLAYLFLPAKC